jgi:hypothetical protein
MRWTTITEIITQPYEVLVELYPTKTRYFLIQNHTDYSITVKQFNRILQTDTLNQNYTVCLDKGIEERLYKSKLM